MFWWLYGLLRLCGTLLSTTQYMPEPLTNMIFQTQLCNNSPCQPSLRRLNAVGVLFLPRCRTPRLADISSFCTSALRFTSQTQQRRDVAGPGSGSLSCFRAFTSFTRSFVLEHRIWKLFRQAITTVQPGNSSLSIRIYATQAIRKWSVAMLRVCLHIYVHICVYVVICIYGHVCVYASTSIHMCLL